MFQKDGILQQAGKGWKQPQNNPNVKMDKCEAGQDPARASRKMEGAINSRRKKVPEAWKAAKRGNTSKEKEKVWEGWKVEAYRIGRNTLEQTDDENERDFGDIEESETSQTNNKKQKIPGGLERE